VGKPKLATLSVARDKLGELAAALQPCVVGLETCSGAHHCAGIDRICRGRRRLDANYPAVRTDGARSRGFGQASARPQYPWQIRRWQVWASTEGKLRQWRTRSAMLPSAEVAFAAADSFMWVMRAAMISTSASDSVPARAASSRAVGGTLAIRVAEGREAVRALLLALPPFSACVRLAPPRGSVSRRLGAAVAAGLAGLVFVAVEAGAGAPAGAAAASLSKGEAATLG
jgi:hypothetical protein